MAFAKYFFHQRTSFHYEIVCGNGMSLTCRVLGQVGSVGNLFFASVFKNGKWRVDPSSSSSGHAVKSFANIGQIGVHISLFDVKLNGSGVYRIHIFSYLVNCEFR
jgi:hypothetical protein